MPTTWNALFLGNFATQLDPDDSSGSDSENAGFLVGQTIGSPSEPLSQSVVSVETIDNGGVFGELDTNNSLTNDQIRFDLGDGGGIQTTIFDSVVGYWVRVYYDDGSSAVISGAVFQDVDGNTFLAPETSDNADHAALEAKPIDSVRIENIIVSSGVNLTTNRQETEFVCYTTGTLIDTPSGARPIETLKCGMSINTVDSGPTPILWMGHSKVEVTEKNTPISIKEGALGRNQPSKTLTVSPQHRMLSRSPIARRMFKTDEVLIAAKKLTCLPGISDASESSPVEYWHLLLPSHELIVANGAIAETFLPGPQAMEMLGQTASAKLKSQISEHVIQRIAARPARYIPSPPDQRKFAARHLKNNKLLISNASVPA